MNDNTTEVMKRLTEAYEDMLERAHGLLVTTEERSFPVLRDALRHAADTMVEVGEFTRDETERVRVWLERDMHDAAEHLEEDREDLSAWFRFDMQLIENRLLETFASLADQTALRLRELAEEARAVGVWKTGEVTGPGTLVCDGCGKELHFHKVGHIPPCPGCKGTSFRRGVDA
ncbi:MAG: zinc ribbon-containing protein [Gammaproteobacteria bacterium]